MDRDVAGGVGAHGPAAPGELGSVSVDTVMDAVEEHGRPLVDDPERAKFKFMVTLLVGRDVAHGFTNRADFEARGLLACPARVSCCATMATTEFSSE